MAACVTCTPPIVHRPCIGDRTTCLRRDCEVKITGWTDALISWPMGGRNAPSIVLDEELARVVRMESAAVMHGGACPTASGVARRKAPGVGRMDNPGSVRLILAASEKGTESQRGVELPPEQVERICWTALELNLGRNLKPGYNLGPCRTEEEIVLLGQSPDAEVAKRTNRTTEAVRSRASRREYRTRPPGPAGCHRKGTCRTGEPFTG